MKIFDDLYKNDTFLANINTQREFQKKIWHLSVEDLLEVGRATKKNFMKYNINTIGNTWSEFLKKNITTDEEVKIVLYKLTESVTERLCKHGFVRSVTQDYGTKKLYDFVDLIGAITYTPFIEELVFRGLFFNLTFNILDMENKVVKYIAITTNIMMFMSIHYVDYSLANYNILFSLLISVVPNLAISTSLVYVYFKTRDIKYNIILHMLYNFIIILISFIKQLY